MIVFTNTGEIDIRAISTFGVSVKESDNPIGFFGTGLKYAISVLLRTGHEIEIHSGETVVRFGLLCDSVRGQEFQFVTMATGDNTPMPIGFTTELGKQWQLWMAYREIACNCKDENGPTSQTVQAPEPVAGETHIIVRGDAFSGVHASRHLYLLEDEAWHTTGPIEVRDREGHDLFYRGVRVFEMPRKSIYTYNLTEQIELTEDRTVKDQWMIGSLVVRGVLQSDNAEFIRRVVIAEDGTLESGLDFHGWGVKPSQTFIRVCGDVQGDRMLKMNSTALKVWKEATKKEFTPREVTLTKVQLMALNRALDFCGTIGFPIRDSYPIKVVESLGEGGLGLAKDQTIFLAERGFHLGGSKQIASTLIEEYLHLRHGWKDMTRELQSFLFDKLVSLGEELQGEPL
jgi:hypothetical protein